MNKGMNKGDIAFWEYDLYPFVLHGEVTKINPDKTVEVLGYDGFRFKPLMILSKDNGIILINKLEALEKSRDISIKLYNNQAMGLISNSKKAAKNVNKKD